MVLYESVKPLLKRVPTFVNTTFGIQSYGSDNLYPQVCEEIIAGSYTLKSLTNRIADFINGEGFVDPFLNTLKVNTRGLAGETLLQILEKVCKPFQIFETVPLFIGYDLNYRICSIEFTPFAYLRYDIADKYGNVDYMKYSTNWERDFRKDNINQQIITPYHVFNPRPEVVSQQIEECGGIQNYKGQILYFTPDEFQYPRASCDPVLDHAQAQQESGIYKVAALQNGFNGTLAVMYPGEFESDTEKTAFQELIKNKTGARNANSRIGLQDKSGTRKVSDMFIQMQPVNVDKLWQYTEESAMNAIIENEGWPKILMGVNNDTMFNTQDMEQAYTYANSITRTNRTKLSQLFSMLLSYWSTPIVTDAAIKPQRYIAEELITNDPSQVNDNLKNMNPKQFQQLQRIIRKYNKEEITEAIARQMIKQSFGVTDAEVDIFLDINQPE